MTTHSGNRFAVGTFRPNPRAAGTLSMLTAQARLELILLLRNGEQLLLTMFIPIAMLVGLCLLPIGDFGRERQDMIVPAIMAVAVMSTAFTGQAIAVGFDRRYGALKRLGATALPRWGVIAGKSLAVLIVVIIQSIILGLLGFALGWRPSLSGLALGALVIALGTVMFACLGLLLGGTLKAEIVLALGNLLWFVMLGIGSLVMFAATSSAAHLLARLTPSGALTAALHRATTGGWDWVAIGSLVVWAAVGAGAAVRYFRFT